MTGLPDLPAPCRLISYETLGSTNEEARRLATDGADAWTFVWAREQSLGRGRRGNGWVSPPGNLYLSVVVRPDCNAVSAAQLGFVAALALADAVDTLTGLQVRLKWPNDLLLDGSKLSGILVESTSSSVGRVDWVVIGTGVNLASHPAEIADTTSLAAQGFAVTVEAMIGCYAGFLVDRVSGWQRDGFAAVRRDWLGRASGIGDAIRVRLAGREERGIFEDLDESGALVLVQGTRRQLITSGDVFPIDAT